MQHGLCLRNKNCDSAGPTKTVSALDEMMTLGAAGAHVQNPGWKRKLHAQAVSSFRESSCTLLFQGSFEIRFLAFLVCCIHALEGTFFWKV